ncbi:MAG: septum formation initiator family protein [Flavobacterium sp.]|nr:septum formation initiator family protein [Candidatus Neoflavobacterium equi]
MKYLNHPIFTKYPFLKKWINRYTVTLVLFVVWMVFFDNYSVLDHIILNGEISELNDNREYYKEEIRKDAEQIKLLKQDEQIEGYAREKYYMKRENEDIYIIDFESEDTESTVK